MFTCSGGFLKFSFGLGVFSLGGGEESSLGLLIGLSGGVNVLGGFMGSLSFGEFIFSFLEGFIEVSGGFAGNFEVVNGGEVLVGLGDSDVMESFLLGDVELSLGLGILERGHVVEEGEVSEVSTIIFSRGGSGRGNHSGHDGGGLKSDGRCDGSEGGEGRNFSEQIGRAHV